jgi:hypothetical protein
VAVKALSLWESAWYRADFLPTALGNEEKSLLRSPQQLRPLLAKAGVAGNKKVVSYCEVWSAGLVHGPHRHGLFFPPLKFLAQRLCCISERLVDSVLLESG